MKERVRRTGATTQARMAGSEREAERVHSYICPACHAILTNDVWFVDEQLYRRLDGRPGVRAVVCPGCRQVVQGLYQGEVTLRSPLLVTTKSAAFQLIGREEERARCANPVSRLTTVEDRGDEIMVRTTTPVLAERIGRAFHRVYDGDLEIHHQPWYAFCRVHWRRD